MMDKQNQRQQAQQQQQAQHHHHLSSAILSAAPLLPAAGQQQQDCGCGSGLKAVVPGCPSHVENIHVFDPVNKRAYTLLHDTSVDHPEVLVTAGLATYFKAKEACASKRFFLCKQYQNSKCRAFHNCNSIHACRAKVATLRQQHPPTKQALEADVILPLYSDEAEGGAFTVPMDRTERTTGRDHLLTTFQGGGVGKLCPGYGQRPPSCTNPSCPNIHVDANHMKHVRGMWRVPCCSDPACIGEPAASQVVFPKFGEHTIQGFTFTEHTKVGSGGGKVYWPKEALGITKGLRELDYNAIECRGDGLYVRFQPGKLCRPHQRRACKWGADCNNLHVCRAKAAAEQFGVAWPTSASSSEFSTPTSSPNASPRGIHSRHASIWSEASSTSPVGSPRHTHQQIPIPEFLQQSQLSIAPLLSSFRNFQLPTGGMNGF